MNNKIKVKISVKRPNAFLKKLIDNKINIYDIKQDDNIIEIIIDYANLEIIEKSKVVNDYKIMNYYGKEKVKRQISKYKIIIISFIIGILINILLSNMILKVEIKTPNKKLKQLVKKDLYSLGIKPLRHKLNNEEEEKIKKELLKKDKDKIEWIEIENQGTKYIVTIEEKKEIKDTKCSNRDVVAKKKAILTKIESSSGEIVKKKYDYVEKGEVVISGTIHNKDDIVSYKCAEGKIIGETWYKVIVDIPTETIISENENKQKWKLNIELKENKKMNQWRVIKEYNIIKSQIYPMKINIVHLQKIKTKRKKYTLNNVNKEAFKVAEQRLKKQLSENPNIIQKKVLKKNLKNSKIIVEVFFAIEEDITSYQPIIVEEEKEG